MKNTKLVDSIELPLKSLDNVLTAINKILECGLRIYLRNFIASFIGDWPMQFFIRQFSIFQLFFSTDNSKKCSPSDRPTT